jgi:tripartite-type tricarboxylate transporter receptor subunit TctC
MRNLVAEMAEQGAVWLAHGVPLPFAFGIISFGETKRDETFGMTGQHRRCRSSGGGEEIEGQATLGVFGPGRMRQIQPQDRVEQPVLGNLNFTPARQVLRNREVGDGPVVTASGAEGLRAVGQHHPVANLVLGILAEPIAIGRVGQRVPAITIRLERAHNAQFGQVAKATPAAVTGVALEVERLLAILAFEQFHVLRPIEVHQTVAQTERVGRIAVKPLAIFAWLAAILAVAPVAHAEYPERPVKVVLGLAAGGGADVLTRWYVDKLRQVSGGTYVIENKVGASGNIAADAVAKAKPDGYTLMFSASASMGGNRFIYKNLPFDTVKDFDPITTFCQLGFALLVNPEKTPVNSVAELTALLKQKNGKATYGWAVTSGLAASVLYTSVEQISVVPVAYKTTAAAVSDLAAGQVDFVFADIMFATAQQKQGRVKILATSANRRAAMVPDVPTMEEAGVKAPDQTPWWAVWGPHGLPPEVVSKLAKWVNQITEMPDTKEFLTSQGADPLPGSPEKTKEMLQRSIATWAKVVGLAKIEPQ